MKIAYCAPEIEYWAENGGGAHVRGVVEELIKRGHEIILFCQKGKKEVNIQGITAIEFKKEKIPIYFFRLLTKVPSLIRKYKPELIYSRAGILDMCITLGGIKDKIPIVLEVNNPAWNRFTAERASHIITTDKRLMDRNQINKKLEDRTIPVEEVFWAVNTEKFKPRKKNLEIINKYNLKDKLVIGYTGCFDRAQDYDIVVKAAGLIRNEYVIFLMPGDGEQYSYIKEVVKKKSLEKKVVFPGKVEFNKIPDYISVMDICLATYYMSHPVHKKYGLYGNPMKIFEYMAMQKAVIATRAGKIQEIISDNEDGLLIEPHSATDLKNKIEKLINNREEMERLGRNARKKAVKEFSWEKHVSNLEKIFRKAKFKEGAQKNLKQDLAKNIIEHLPFSIVQYIYLMGIELRKKIRIGV